MASTVALFTGLNGLNAHARKIDVIGNNIANVNTTAFKTNRTIFSDMLSRTLDQGQPPGDGSGGTNPSQIGLGVAVAGTQRDFSAGSLSPTGNAADMAIDGNGFFIVQRGDERFFTRAGEFTLDENNQLVTLSGDRLLGLPVDEQFNVEPGELAPISVPIGELTVAEATTEVRIAGNLNASGELAVSGSSFRLGATDQAGFGLIAAPALPPAPGNAIEAASLLTDVADPTDATGGTALFQPGQSITLEGARKGTASLPPASLEVQADTTIQDLMDFLTAALGIAQTGTPNADGSTPGFTLDETTGELSLVGNVGTANAIELEPQDLRVVGGDGTTVAFPFDISQTGQATGESVRTAFEVFDSLGTAVDVDLTFVLESRNDTGNVWRYFAESAADSDDQLQLATGTIQFDPFGRLAGPQPAAIAIDRAGTGAVDPLEFELSFQGEQELTSLSDTGSQVLASFRNGAPIGTLEDFAVARDGRVIGSFSNTLSRTLGRVQLATFSNAAGLSAEGGNLFTPSANSGLPVVVDPETFGAGGVVGGSVERSNVDLGREFIELILSSTGYNASSRVIQTTDELMQTLLALGR